ncbi:Vegetative incompatibility protein HET-E-1 [Fusarium oxysporum f. sp. rapae]|uniref:Vegetative incompatibility protein HET-E-1 n=1 Tax=Fusarium oxysporum f. sp. rapae TaxID=485398 RepID=A0A8J5NF87_FUSOX|nr:Vegetative incompatibility protein HET-E-1 [Fusarium oxysporum f. sp. rapae]
MADALGVASGVIAVVDLSAKIIKWCVQYAHDVSHAEEDKKRLADEITRLNLASVNAFELLHGPHGSRLKASHALYQATVNSQSQLRHIESQLAEGSGQAKTGFEALKWPFKNKDLQSVIQDLQRCTEAIYSALEVDQTSILLNLDHKIALDTLPVAEGASFDSHAEEHNPTCLPNTREELLKEIDSWIDDPKSKTIFWLNGMAGTGKSTISRTVAQRRYQRGDLGASFFFKRGETDRGSLAKFVTTVARRLAWSTPGVASFIKSAADADPAIADKAVREQFEKLVREPLSKVTATSLSRPSIVIVVDALDECERDANIKLLLELFSTLRFAGSLRVRVLITSRPELPVRHAFSSIGDTHQDLILHKIPKPIIEHDMSVFLRHEFANIRNCFNEEAVDELKLPVDWPGEANLEKLTMAAVPLFIFAATLCRFVNDSCLGSPDELLQSVLHVTGTGQASKLDMTYSPVLTQQVIGRSGRERCDIVESFRLIVGTIAEGIAFCPGGSRKSRFNETVEFWVDERLTHRKLAKHCLRVMRSALREDICGLSFPGIRRSTVDGSQLEESIPPQLQYAGMYWVHHHVSSNHEPNDSQEVYEFLATHFLHWVEALSLMGRVKECLDSLRSLARWLEKQEDSSLSIFVADAVQFLQASFSVVAEAPLQVYSYLVFAPSKSVVRKTFEKAIPRWISILPKVEENWDACLLTLEGHSDLVGSVVFSHNSKKVASASSDKTIRIWNAETGKCERVLEGHSDLVRSVVFSHDSKKVASASWDKTVRIWDVEMGKCERVLEDHSDDVSSAVFSHDSKKVASGSDDKTIRIWNAATGDCERVLEGHSDAINSVVFSHDSTKVASGSDDNTVRIWNAETGECERVLEGHSDDVNSVVFSHDSTKVASAGDDNTVRIWNAETGKCERVLEGHSSYVNSVVFSHNSKKVASASWDKTIRIWNAEMSKCERVLEGRSSVVLSLVFSHNSKKVASAGDDNTVRIWNAEMDECERVLEGHSSVVLSLVFSHDSKR